MAGNSGDDPAWMLVLIIGVLALLGWLLWHFYEPQFLEILRYLRLVETALISPIDRHAASCVGWLWKAPVGQVVPSNDVYDATLRCFGPDAIRSLQPTEAMKYYNITTDSLGQITNLVGTYFRWGVVAVCAFWAYHANFVTKRNSFKVRHNLETFIKAQAKMWPVITPIMDFNPSKHSARILGSEMPDKTPLFAEAFAPEEWLAYHRIAVVNGVPDREAVRRAFCLQLGPRWTGFDDLPAYMQGLAAAYALKGVQKREESDEFLGRLSTFWTAKDGFRPSSELLAEIKSLLKDPAIGGKALEVASKHAYRTTALLGLLKWARFMGGVLAAAQFLWLRGVDRDLWYSLNNQGRRSFFTEGAGAVAHFVAEEQAGKALPIPRMDTAIVTLNIYMGGDVPITVPPREEPKKANR